MLDPHAMRSWLEFHDSILDFVEVQETGVALTLCGYVHRWDESAAGWKGTAWLQPVGIWIDRGIADPVDAARIPQRISDGELRIDSIHHDNLVPLPTAATGRSLIRLALETGDILEVRGEGASVETLGEARFVEELAGDLRPNGG